ncbi:hypothetical protein HY251_19180 [bacterium]|nr:hypothetical protein [bacterium]
MSLSTGETSAAAELSRRIEAAIERGRSLGRSAPLAIVAIGGTAATGKTTLARELAARSSVSAGVLATDGYMMARPERRRRGITGPNPAANDLPRLAGDISRIARGEAGSVLVRLETPEGRRSVEQPFAVSPLVIVEGLVALYPELGASYDLTVFLDGPPLDELAVRLDRDVNERAHPKGEVEEVFWLRQREYDRFLRPSGESADVKLWASRKDGRYRLELGSGGA